MISALDDKTSIYQMMYMMELLSYKGISISETIEKSLEFYVENYKNLKDERFLQIAVLQVKIGLEFGVRSKKSLLLYNEVCCLGKMSFEDILKKELFISKKIKLNKSQVGKIFRKWRRSKTNAMTKAELVADVIVKVSDKIIGNYVYCYPQNVLSDRESLLKNDIYHLVITDTECYLFDLKGFTIYTFTDSGRRGA